MSTTTRAFIVAILAAICIAALAQVEYQTVRIEQKQIEGGSKTYVMSLQKCNANSDWTIHGLWPEWGMNCGGAKFDIKQLAPIRNDLNQYWLSCPGHQGNEAFWNHEWTKHGTCTNYTQVQYFAAGLSVYKRFKAECNNKLRGGECRFCVDMNLNEC